jgi:hypothetical protein
MRGMLDLALRILCVVTGQAGLRVIRRIIMPTVRVWLGRRGVGSVRQILKPSQNGSGAIRVMRRLVLPVSRSWTRNETMESLGWSTPSTLAGPAHLPGSPCPRVERYVPAGAAPSTTALARDDDAPQPIAARAVLAATPSRQLQVSAARA